MSMPIQRQSESFGIFDDGPRFARDRSSHDLPKGLAGLVNSFGPRITAGMLNTRTAGEGLEDTLASSPSEYAGGGVSTSLPGAAAKMIWNGSTMTGQESTPAFNPGPAKAARIASCDYCGEPGHEWDVHPEARADVTAWEREKAGLEFPFGDHHEASRHQAVNVDGMDPSSHAYHQESYGGPYDPGGQWVGDEDGYQTPRREWNPDSGYEPSWLDERNHELVAEDDESGYNWGPEPDHVRGIVGTTASRLPFVGDVRRRIGKEYNDLPPLPGDFSVPDHIGEENNTSAVEPWTDPEEFIKYHNDYFGRESDPTTQRNIRDMSPHSLHDYWQDLESQRGKSGDQIRQERQQSKDKAKELADGLWNAIYPPEEEEGRKAVQGMDTVNRLMDNGWGPEHIKYDEDDQPYAQYQHPSGWTVTDHGGMYKEIGHVATPNESHDVINVGRNVGGQDYHAPFGPADAHSHIEEQLHGDPEETGGYLQYLTQNHPQIRRYKIR